MGKSPNFKAQVEIQDKQDFSRKKRKNDNTLSDGK